jgi:hypothetical protein
MHILHRDRLTREYRAAGCDNVTAVRRSATPARAIAAPLTAVVLAVAALVGCADPDEWELPPPVTPSTAPIDTVNWAEATVRIPPNGTGCEAGEARFAQGRATVGGTPYQMFTEWAAAPLYADFDHDGRLDAVIAVACARTPGAKNPPALLLAISGADDRHPMGTLFAAKPRPEDGAGSTFAAELHLVEEPAVRYIDRTWEGTSGCEVEWVWERGEFTHRSVDDSPACS